MILLDTHTLIWHLSNSRKITQKGRKSISRELKSGHRLLVSSITIWEIFLLAKKDKIKLDRSPNAWLEEVEQLSYLEFIPINNQIAANSIDLPEPLHNDPADRIIAATAREYGATLVTSDQRLRKYPHVQTLW